MYPPKHPKNGTRHHPYNGGPFWPEYAWPGDTYDAHNGCTYVFQSDGSGWRIISKPQRKAA